MSGREVQAILLAGGLKPGGFQEEFGLPVLCLPLEHDRVLLHAWEDVLASNDSISKVKVVVNSERDVRQIQAVGYDDEGRERGSIIEPIVEPKRWRGPAGIVADLLRESETNSDADSLVLVIEANALPILRFDTLFAAIENTDNAVCGVVGVTDRQAPAGAFLFRRDVFDRVPSVGYFDLKEQLLPKLYREEQRVVAAPIASNIKRVHDRRSYLKAVCEHLHQDSAAPISSISDRASVSGSAIIDGCCVVEPGAVIEDGAIVHDSVVLNGATVGGGAVVTRSVIGALANVPPRERVVRRVVADQLSPSRMRIRANRKSAAERSERSVR